jgi:hypothetical protein
LLSTSCAKEDPVNQITTYNLVSEVILPGEAVEIISNRQISDSQIEVMIDGKVVKAYANGEYSYVFIIPVVIPGNYMLKLTNIDNNITLKLKVNNYVAITNPEEVIDHFV